MHILTTPHRARESRDNVAPRLEALLGGDERVAVHDTTRFPWRAICQLEVHFATGARLVGSGALIGPDVVLTAAHCVYEHRLLGEAREILVAPGRKGHRLPYGQHRATIAWLHEAWKKRRSPDRDVAVLRLAEAVGDRTGWFGLAPCDGRYLRRAVLNLAGYPVDLPVAPLEERGKHQYWSASKPLRCPPGLIHYSADTYYGQSGSPVWIWTGQRQIVAVHTTGATRYNAATRITPELSRLLASLVTRRASVPP